MIKCPQCSYHNIDDHRFCQQCGTSLTQKQCANCGHLVDFEMTHCLQCEHPTATIWWTLLTPVKSVPEQFADRSLAAASAAAQASTSDSVNLELAEDPSTEELLDTIEKLVNDQQDLDNTVDELRDSEPRVSPLQTVDSDDNGNLTSPQINPVLQRFLAQNPRYQLLEVSTALHSPPIQSNSHEFNILDAQPFQISPLAVMLSQLQGATDPTDMSQPGTITTFLETQPLPFPIILEPYLALRQQFPLLLPYVHDAWESEQQSIILLENRTALPTAKEVLAKGKLRAAQVVNWLQQTLDFAAACSPWGCLSSILQVDNLKVDQGRILCLQQLLFDPEQSISGEASRNDTSVQPAVWDDLRHIWLDLLQGLGATLGDQFHPLLTNLQSDEDVTQAKLQWYLSDLSQQLPTAVPSVSPVRLLQPATVPEEGGAAPTLILPNQLIHLAAAGQTDEGRDRHHNEDFFVIEQQFQQSISPHQQYISGRGLYILCDGMGGHAGGEVASSLAAETLTQYFKTHWHADHLPDAETLKDAISTANHALLQVNKAKAGSNRMGTTLVMALVQDTHVHIAHVGDSRLYRLTHQDGLEQITVDHEVGQREIHRGMAPEVAYARPDAYQLTQALGPRESEALEPDIQLLTATEDTLFLICSDGLTDNQLLEAHCDQHLLPMLNAQITLQQGVNELVLLANEHNGHDNITVIAILMRVHPQRMSSC